jgi:rhodanese-related sulfurtransferase
MSWGGNTIARALALVTVATGAAFVDWGVRPFTMKLADPRESAEAADTVINDVTDTEGANGGSSDPIVPDDGATSTPPANNGAPAAFDATTLGTEIGTEDTYQLWLSGEATFIDARPQHEYIAGHIPYAFLVPPDTLKSGRLGEMMEVGGVFPDMRVVVYCEGGDCDASHLVALYLQDMGFTKIHIDVDGFPSWAEAGHEVHTGPDELLGDVP